MTLTGVLSPTTVKQVWMLLSENPPSTISHWYLSRSDFSLIQPVASSFQFFAALLFAVIYVACVCVFQVWRTGRTMRSWPRCWPFLSRSTWTAWNTRALPCIERGSRRRTAADNWPTHKNTTMTFDLPRTILTLPRSQLWPPEGDGPGKK